MSVSVIVATHGDPAWEELSWSRAYPSTLEQGAPTPAWPDATAVDVIVAHEADATLAEVRNRAAATARGDWLCFLDADDELCPGYVTAMMHELNRWLGRPDADWVRDQDPLLAPAVLYCHEGRARGPAAVPNAGRWPDLNECVIGTLVSRPLFHLAGGFRELPSLEDYDLWLRCAKLGARIVHVPDAVYRVHVTRGSRNSDQSTYDQLRAEHAAAWA